jgi:hypothetical protein
VVTRDFQKEIDNGKLTFQVLNLEDEANAALDAKYGAYTSSLYVNVIVDGVEHIQDIENIWVWGCTGKQSYFDAKVKDTITLALQGKPQG